MSEHNITVQGGSSVRLPTAGKYCDRDIVVTAEGGGTELPILDNPATAADIVKDKQVIGADGSVITGTVEDPGTRDWYLEQYLGHDFVNSKVEFAGMFDAGNGTVLRGENPMVVQFPASYLGNAAAGDVAAGKTFTSAAGLNVVGTAQAGGGLEACTIVIWEYAGSNLYFTYTDKNGVVQSGSVCGSSEAITAAKGTIIALFYDYGSIYVVAETGVRNLYGGGTQIAAFEVIGDGEIAIAY